MPDASRAVGAPLAVAVCFWALGLPDALAGSVEVAVTNTGGESVEGAVVSAVAGDGGAAAGAPGEAMIDQKDKEFVPRVIVVRAGTQVHFPNSDNIRHHVYSFSPAKTFEIPLYKGTPAAPIRFDQPGVVVLGCNIHDWMSAYVFVSETPYFATTGANGRAVLRDLPPGRYEVELWHPQLKGPPRPARHPLTVPKDGQLQIGFEIEQKPAWRARAAGALRGGYR